MMWGEQMLLVIGVSTGISIIVSLVITKIAVIKHFKTVDDYLEGCTNELKKLILSIVTKGSSK